MREITTLRRGKEGERDGERGRERGREGGRRMEREKGREGGRKRGRGGRKKEMARLTLLAILYHPYLHHKILHCSDYVYLYHENIK